MMGYKRLTMKKEYGCSLCHDRKCKKPNLYCKDRLECETYNRLAELEDKIEQGTLVELPCKVGDTAYYETFIQSKSQGIKPHKVIGFVLEVMTQDIGGFGCTAVPIKDFGKDVFLTREEAEKRLKELQE